MAENEWSDVVEAIVVQVFREDVEEEHDVIRNAPLLSPITKQSLSELDIESIINNSKLRHDVNLDRELHFRPNMDGERGMRKRSAQTKYWRAITLELEMVYRILQAPIELGDKSQLVARHTQRLHTMFGTVKDILLTLVPERDIPEVEERLDVLMTMQKIKHGVLDFVSLAQWLAQLLKRHCAPMRDELVDRMVEKISMETPEDVTSGLADLFSVLEAMKLDVANHQIRHLRALLIEDSINFEHQYHCSRIRKNKCRSRRARQWFSGVQKKDQTNTSTRDICSSRDVETFMHGLLQLLLPTSEPLPDTFILDQARVENLRNDFQSLHEDVISKVGPLSKRVDDPPNLEAMVTSDQVNMPLDIWPSNASSDGLHRLYSTDLDVHNDRLNGNLYDHKFLPSAQVHLQTAHPDHGMRRPTTCPDLHSALHSWHTSSTCRIFGNTPRFMVIALCASTVAAMGYTEASFGLLTGALSLWTAHISQHKADSVTPTYFAAQALTITCLALFIFSTTHRMRPHRSHFFWSSLVLGLVLAGIYPRQSFDTAIEAFLALGYGVMAYAFDHATACLETFKGVVDSLWTFLDWLRPRRRSPEPDLERLGEYERST